MGNGLWPRSSRTSKLCEAYVLLNSRPWRTQALALSFTDETSDGRARELTFVSRRRTYMRSLLEVSGLSDATTAAPGGYRPIRVQLTREQEQLVCLYAQQHPHTTMARLALWAKGRFGFKHAPSRSSISGMLKRRQVQLASVPGEELPAKKRRTAGRPKLATGPYVGAAAAPCLVLSETGPLTSTALQQQPGVPALSNSVRALQLMIQLAGQMRCSLPLMLELNRMLRERSAAPTRPAAAIFGESTRPTG